MVSGGCWEKRGFKWFGELLVAVMDATLVLSCGVVYQCFIARYRLRSIGFTSRWCVAPPASRIPISSEYLRIWKLKCRASETQLSAPLLAAQCYKCHTCLCDTLTSCHIHTANVTSAPRPYIIRAAIWIYPKIGQNHKSAFDLRWPWPEVKYWADISKVTHVYGLTCLDERNMLIPELSHYLSKFNGDLQKMMLAKNSDFVSFFIPGTQTVDVSSYLMAC